MIDSRMRVTHSPMPLPTVVLRVGDPIVGGREVLDQQALARLDLHHEVVLEREPAHGYRQQNLQ